MAKNPVLWGCNVGTLDRLSTGLRNALLGRAFVPGDLAERNALDALFSSCAFDAMVASQAGYATKAHDRHY
jgi:UDP-glucose 4-epimerase